MWPYVLRKLLYNIPVYLGILLIVMVALRVNDPVWAHLGSKTRGTAGAQERYETKRTEMGLDRPFAAQYAAFVGQVATLDFDARSWDRPTETVGAMLRRAIIPTLMITVPSLVLTTVISICIGLVASYFRGGWADRTLMLLAVLGMSISYVVYIILGQYFAAYKLREWAGVELFAIQGYEPGIANWPYYCLLPVLIGVVVAVGYDTRYYRAVMVEETTRDYIATARAKGATKPRIMFVHMLKNAMIPVISRVMISVPFLIEGSILLEFYFNIPGMGKTMIEAIIHKDFPVIQAFTAVLAGLFIVSNILTDVLYAWVDPRVRLS
ncbi:MAG: ABC transporter permease [Phycisphaerales bacterium]